MLYGICHTIDGKEHPFRIAEEEKDGCTCLTVGEPLAWETVDSLDFDTGLFTAHTGEDGFYLIAQGSGPQSEADSGLTCFTDRPDGEWTTDALALYLLGAKTKRGTYAAIVTGNPYESVRVVRVKGGEYRLFPRFRLKGRAPEEPIAVEVTRLPDTAGWVEMAHCYRTYRLTRCHFRTLRNRQNETLTRAAESLYVRVRLGWKPVPSPVPDQTPENEPPMHVACTFAEVENLMDEYHAAGIVRAEFCLVGWNMRGHDGRYPQLFPVEESLGGEKGLRRLTAHAADLGYLISCHTNSTGAYGIADCFSEDDLIVEENGRIYVAPNGIWSAGRPYRLCPTCGLRQAEENLPRVRALGFTGLHYIDVMSAVPPRACYSQAHPLTRREGAETWARTLALARDRFGGSASEGGYDHCLAGCDYVLYASFAEKGTSYGGWLDVHVPLFSMVYHGILLYNPYCRTVNAAVSRDPDDRLKVIEYGGRPAIYYYSRFVKETADRKNWMGDIDYVYENRETHKKFVAASRTLAEEYDALSYLQWELMENHEEIAPGVYRTTYADGSRVTVDYEKKTWQLEKGEP